MVTHGSTLPVYHVQQGEQHQQNEPGGQEPLHWRRSIDESTDVSVHAGKEKGHWTLGQAWGHEA